MVKKPSNKSSLQDKSISKKSRAKSPKVGAINSFKTTNKFSDNEIVGNTESQRSIFSTNVVAGSSIDASSIFTDVDNDPTIVHQFDESVSISDNEITLDQDIGEIRESITEEIESLSHGSPNSQMSNSSNMEVRIE